MEQKTAFHMKVGSQPECKSKKSHLFLSTQLSGWKWGWIWDGALRKMPPSNTQVPQIFIQIVHSHPSVSRTKACPEFGTLSCPRCLEWGHWEDSCWAIDHVCERWLLWEMKRLHWQWQVTFSDVVMLVTLRLFMMSRTSNRSATRSQIPFKQNCLPPALWRVFTLVHAEKSHCGHSWLGAVPRLVLRSDL